MCNIESDHMNNAVEIIDLVKTFANVIAVDGASFSIPEGEIFGLIGPNGAGKTTTLRIISTLLDATSGTVKVFDHDVEKEASEVRKLISYLPEDAGAYKNLTGRGYLTFIAKFFGKGREVNEIVRKGVAIADLEERIDDKVDTYSKGMMRRLLVGRALMIDPKLAILDEPTSGLDVINAQEVRRIIKRSVREGTTALVSSHNMLEVEFLCDTVALINEGRIVEKGSPSELKNKYTASNIEEVFTAVVQ